MPASYAHYRFGKKVLPNLPPDTRQCIQRFRRMFDMGLQGPDFFFYYNPVMKTQTGSLGGMFHEQSGQEFFTRCCAAASSEAGRAYLYGLLGHYTLDSVCHPFVDRMVSEGKARHVALESEFDRFLMAADGKSSPSTYCISDHLKLTRGECMTVASFFPPATGAQVYQGVRIMAFALNFLAGGNRAKREKLLKKINPGLLDSFVPEAAVTEYARLDEELLARFDRCLTLYPKLLAQLEDHRKQGTPLGEDFAPTFETGRL